MEDRKRHLPGPVKVLASLFRRRFLEGLARAHGKGEIAHLANPGEFHAALAAARRKGWVVYTKRPFRGPEQVFRYLARYTHRIAISDRRITAFDGRTVSFRYRKPGKPGRRKPRYGTATVAVDEFIRRFLLHVLPHVLPDRLHRIRHFVILATSCRARTLESARKALGAAACALADHGAVEDLDGEDDRDAGTAAPVTCAHCGAVLRQVSEIPRRQASHPTRAPPGARQNQTPQP